MNDPAFAWVIEMQGASYLGVRKLGCYEFFWRAMVKGLKGIIPQCCR